jgi:hypothetical protein
MPGDDPQEQAKVHGHCRIAAVAASGEGAKGSRDLCALPGEHHWFSELGRCHRRSALSRRDSLCRSARFARDLCAPSLEGLKRVFIFCLEL